MEGIEMIFGFNTLKNIKFNKTKYPMQLNLFLHTCVIFHLCNMHKI